jgi:hypothetical protein
MSKQRDLLTYELVRELFDYKDGGLYWKSSVKRHGWPGDRFGSIRTDGYRYGTVRGVNALEHRLIFLWHNGYYPEQQIDHIDRCRSNNRIENLREVSQICNSRNRKVQANNKSGVTGVHKTNGYWLVNMRVNGTTIHICYTDNFINAVASRWKAEVEHNYPNCSSTSSAYTYLKERGLIDCDGNLVENMPV